MHLIGISITGIDEFQVVLERMTAPAQYPALHHVRTDSESFMAFAGEGTLGV